jgi:hypothetical protein
MEGRVTWSADGIDAAIRHAEFWRTHGATHVSVNTMNAGLATVDDHLAVLAQVAGALGLEAH